MAVAVVEMLHAWLKLRCRIGLSEELDKVAEQDAVRRNVPHQKPRGLRNPTSKVFRFLTP